MAPGDTELVKKAQKGDMAAFEQLVHRHDKHVLTIAARYVTSSEDAKDIYQEVLLRVYRGLRNFRFKSEFATWLHRITVNVCLSHRARQRRNHHVSLGGDSEGQDTEGGGAPEPPDQADPPDQVAINNEIALRVQEALGSLSPQQRMVFTLRHYDGYKLKEIASMMNCMEGTVKRYLFAATRRMRNRLQHAYENQDGSR